MYAFVLKTIADGVGIARYAGSIHGLALPQVALPGRQLQRSRWRADAEPDHAVATRAVEPMRVQRRVAQRREQISVLKDRGRDDTGAVGPVKVEPA